MKTQYLIVDVFARGPLSGNALAVFPDGAAIDSERYQAIAREMNLSETAFVTATRPDGYDVRIFTPGSELPFAGHPTLGTAWVLRHIGAIVGDRPTQTSPAGETPVSIALDTVWLERTGTVGRDRDDADAIARALNIAEAAIGFDAAILGMERTALRPAMVDAGIPQLLVPIADPDVLARVRPGPGVEGLSSQGIYCFAPLGSARVKARFFAAGLGIAEDPATGSAAAALGLYLCDRAGELAFEISQGDEVARPSTLNVDAARGRVRVGGVVVLVARGEFILD